MHRIIIGLLTVLAFMALAISLAVRVGSGTVSTAAAFLQAVRDGEFERAYALMSEESRATTTLDELRAFAQQSALGNYRNVTWNTRSVSGRSGQLSGFVATRDGGTVPLEITLVKESSGWRLLSIEKSPAGLRIAGKPWGVPPEEECARMAKSAISDLGQAIRERDFTAFLQHAAAPWRDGRPDEELHAAVSSLCDADLDLQALARRDPVWDAPATMGPDGTLPLQGHYPTMPYVTRFRLTFIFEQAEWKLLDARVTAK